MNLTYYYQATAGQMGAGSTAGNAGQLMAINNNSTINGTTESAAYTYDNLGRLLTSNQTSNGSSAQRRFAYDRWGNRTGVWDAVSGGNQIQTIALEQSGGAPTNRMTSVTSGSTVNYVYDAAGNVTNDGAHSYTYDAENRIVSVDGGAAQYRYDHQNQRVTKIVGSSWTHYIWEGGKVIGEHDATTPYSTTYSSASARLDYVYARGTMINTRQRTSSTAPWTTRYYVSDKWSTRLVLDSSGNVLGRQAHLPFGEEFAESGTQEKHHFTSYEADSESGTDYAVNRQYSQGVGRFQSADPYQASSYLVNPQSWNRYAYVENDPIHNADPQGLFESGHGVEMPDPCFGGFDPIPAPSTCNLNLLKKGDTVLGGYPDQPRVPADFKPNALEHGGHLSPDSGTVPIKERQYYYYLEIQALISSIGNQSDWFFQIRLRRRGWFTYERADGSESERINVDFDDPNEPILKGNFVWDAQGYHHLDNPGLFSWFPVQGSDGSTVYRKVKRSNIVWDFTVTGYHASGGKRDIECNTLTFRLRLRVGDPEPWSFGQ